MRKIFKTSKPLKPQPYTSPEPIDPPTEPSAFVAPPSVGALPPPLPSQQQQLQQLPPPLPAPAVPRRSPTKDTFGPVRSPTLLTPPRSSSPDVNTSPRQQHHLPQPLSEEFTWVTTGPTPTGTEYSYLPPPPPPGAAAQAAAAGYPTTPSPSTPSEHLSSVHTGAYNALPPPPALAPPPQKHKHGLFSWMKPGSDDHSHHPPHPHPHQHQHPQMQMHLPSRRVREPEEQLVFRGGDEQPFPPPPQTGYTGYGPINSALAPAPLLGKRFLGIGGGGRDREREKERERERVAGTMSLDRDAALLPALETRGVRGDIEPYLPSPNGTDRTVRARRPSGPPGVGTDLPRDRERERDRDREKEEKIRGWRANIIAASLVGVGGGGGSGRGAEDAAGLNSWESRKSNYSDRDRDRDRESKSSNSNSKSSRSRGGLGLEAGGGKGKDMVGMNSWESRRSNRSGRSVRTGGGGGGGGGGAKDRGGGGGAGGGDDGWDITREIGWLTAHASEDWVRVLDLCERAKETDATAKEAAKALRKDIKYGEPAAQVSAARLWAILLRNCGEPFVSLCASKKFMDAVELVLTKENAHPVVSERLKHVLASAAYTWPSAGVEPDGRKGGFIGTWRKVRPKDAPEEGYPFDDSDPMFNPPTTPSHLLPATQPEQQPRPLLAVPNPPSSQNLAALALAPASYPPPPPLPARQDQQAQRPLQQRSKTSGRVISPEEDRRRLLEECDIAKSNAMLLREALVFAKPDELEGNPLIQEFYQKCFKSQEIIASQLDWATAQAARSRELINQQANGGTGGGVTSSPPPSNIIISPASPGSPGSLPTPPGFTVSSSGKRTPSPPSQRPLPMPPAAGLGLRPDRETKEEQLLGALLGAHQELLEVFKTYEEHSRAAVEENEEREIEERSRREVRMDRRDLQYLNADGFMDNRYGSGGGSGSQVPTPSASQPGSRSASPAPPLPTPYIPPTPGHISHPLPTPPMPHLAPPPHPPVGPRRRTPSPEGTPRAPAGSTDSFASPPMAKLNGLHIEPSYQPVNGVDTTADDDSSSVPSTPIKPSAKALGKRPVKPVVDDDDNPFDPDDLFKEQGTPRAMPAEEEDDDTTNYDPIKAQLGLWKPVKYAYDAAAEREAERRRMQVREVTTY